MAILLSHVSGLLIGALILSLVGFAVHSILTFSSVRAASFVTSIVLVGGIAWVGRNLPSIGFEVPLVWRRWGDEVYALVFGLALGSGVTTRVPSPGFYVICIWTVLWGQSLALAVVFSAFALGKAIPLVLSMIPAQLGHQNATWVLARYKRAIPHMMFLEAALLGFGVAQSIR